LAHVFFPFHLQKRQGYKKVYWKISPLTVTQVEGALRLLFLQRNGEGACGSAGLKKEKKPLRHCCFGRKHYHCGRHDSCGFNDVGKGLKQLGQHLNHAEAMSRS